MYNKKAFTIVELIVVITILAILATVGFISYSGYLIGVRDTNRMSNIISITEGLDTYGLSNTLPLPDDKIDVKYNGSTISYQGYLSDDIVKLIEFSGKGKDVKEDINFSYYLTKSRNDFQLMGFLEKENSITFNNTNQVNALNYSIKYPYVNGEPLGIITDDTNIPLQEITDIKAAGEVLLDTTNKDDLFISHISNEDKYITSGNLIGYKLNTLANERYIDLKSCPEGFIGVPADANTGQQGFCVAQYEMTYEDANIPNSTGLGGNWSTVSYVKDKAIVSEAGKYPIADLTQEDAISTCKSLGRGYHLLTNKQYVTIARNIELQVENWSDGEIGLGYISSGLSGLDGTETPITSECRGENGGNTSSPTYDNDKTYATKTGEGDDENCNNSRKLKLSNGKYIWDFTGNLLEHINKANNISGIGYNVGNTALGLSSGVSEQWTHTDIDQSELTQYGPLIEPGLEYGMGVLTDLDGMTNTIIVRGGNALTKEFTGLYHMNLGFDNYHSNSSLGFRCSFVK